MVGRSLIAGVASAVREWRLVLLLWLWNLVFGLTAALPFARWWHRSLDGTTEARTLAHGFDLSLILDLVEGDPSLIPTIAAATVAVLLLAALGSLLVSAGVLEVLLSSRRGEGEGVGAVTLLHRFFRGAGTFFGRNFRLSLLHALVTGVVVAVVYWLLRRATSPLRDSLSEAGAWTRFLLPLAGAAAVWLLMSLVLDFGRTHLVMTDERRARRAWITGFGFVRRHVLGTAGFWLVLSAGVVVAYLVYHAVSALAWGPTWPQVVALAVMQQAFLLWRAATRVCRTGGQIEQAAWLGLPGADRVR